MTPVGEIASAIREACKYFQLLLKTSHVRRMRKAVDYGESFILLFDDYTRAKTEVKKQQIKTRMAVTRRRFFKYNQ